MFTFTPNYQLISANADLYDELLEKNQSQDTSVQYFSQDMISNMKIKISIRKINRLASNAAQTNILNKTLQQTEKADRRNEKGELIIKDDIENEYATHTCIVSWQQKIFSPRELLVMSEEAKLDSALEKQYQKDITQIKTKMAQNLYSDPELIHYNQIEKPVDEKATLIEENDELADENEEEQETTRKSMNLSSRKKWGTDGILDLLRHRISTFTMHDGYDTMDEIQQKIECSSLEPYPLKKISQKKSSMKVVANFGCIIKNEKEMRWEGEEYILCIITAMPDGSYIMKPGLSDPIQNVEEQTEMKYEQYLDRQSLIQKQQQKTYTFRTSDSSVYEYTIHLYNETKRDNTIDKLRRKILHHIYERTLISKRNLVGVQFLSTPSSPFRKRIQLEVQLLTAEDFVAESLFVKYMIDLPDAIKLVDEYLDQAAGCTPLVVPVMKSIFGYGNTATLGYTFESQLLIQKEFPSAKILFEVISKDYLDRYRLVGYGYTTIPTISSTRELIIQTWKPKPSFYEKLKSDYLGGAPELEHLSYIARPSSEKPFLNKFGFATESSGKIHLRVQTIVQGS